MEGLDGLSPLSIRFLNCKTDLDLVSLPFGNECATEYDAARYFLNHCSLELLPLYINNPSMTLSNIVKKRLGV